jgi:hypothetical protein
MKNKIDSYINAVMENMVIDERLKERVARDLHTHINEASQEQNLDTILDKMGSPEEVASEFMETIYEDKNEAIERLIQERLKLRQLFKDAFYEYKTKTKLLGRPLLHIKFRKIRGYGTKFGIAKGIIAIGDYASGVVAIGGLCYGGLCIGGYCLGIVTIGGLCAGLISLGGFSLGLAVFGGFAAGIWSLGGFSAGIYTLGGVIAVGIKAVSGIAAFGLYAESDHYTSGLSLTAVSATILLILLYAAIFIKFMTRRIKTIIKMENYDEK